MNPLITFDVATELDLQRHSSAAHAHLAPRRPSRLAALRGRVAARRADRAGAPPGAVHARGVPARAGRS